ncbi:MAG: type II toxin-antitoxin system YafQ family toxin [Oscillospiraceae bacterium]|nr:type II toxin-antitoxin system YafQ family toxin [Oscillospiraceae bacterium]
MNKLRYTLRFRRDYRRGVRKGCDGGKLRALLELLRLGSPLPQSAKDSSLPWAEARACRVEPGWVLVYRAREGAVTLLRVKYIRKERPRYAPPMKLWFKTLLRSPVKTALTVLLLAAACFLFLDNLSGYELQRTAARLAEEGCRGILTLEKTPVRRFLDPHLFNAFLLTDPTSPGETYGRFLYEDLHHRALTAEETETVAALPYVDAADKRYMTAGVSEDHSRMDYWGYYGYTDRIILEATVLWGHTDEDWRRSAYATGFYSEYSDVRKFGLGDVTLLAGDPAWLEEHLEAYRGEARLTVSALRDDLIGTGELHLESNVSRAVVNCLDYELTQAELETVVPGRRYVFVLRASLHGILEPMFYMGDDSRRDWWPYITDVTDLPENYLETEEFAPLRSLIQTTDDDLHTFDVVYTDDMASIRRVAQELITPAQGRFLTPEDGGKAVCVVSEQFLSASGLDLGDTLTLKLGNVLTEQYVPLGAVAVTEGRHATEWEERSFTIVGAFRDVYDGKWLERDLFWAYGKNTVFVPVSFLPAGCDTENHEFRPAELSFLVSDARKILPFEEEVLPRLEEMGLSCVFFDSNWPAVAEKMDETRTLAVLKLLIFSAAALLAVGLTLYLFLHRRRGEYAILRALGSPGRAAARALWQPLFALALFSAALGLGAALLRSASTLRESLREFQAAGLESLPGVRVSVYLLGTLGLLGTLLLLTGVYLSALGRRSPLRLLQDSAGKGKSRAETAAIPLMTEAEQKALAEALTAPLTGRGRPTKGFLGRYVLRHARRAGARTLLALLLAALLAGAAGELTVLYRSYGELVENVEVSVSYYDGLSYGKAKIVEKSGYVHDAAFQKVFKDAELEFQKAQVWFLNRLEGFVPAPVTWLEGWDEESAMSAFSKVCILPAPVMENLGLSLGDEVRINELDCIGNLCYGYHVNPRTWEEMVSLRDAHRNFFTVIGRVETEDDAMIAYAPAAAFPYYSCFGYVLYLDRASFTLNSYYQASEFQRYSDQLMLTVLEPPEFRMDTADADRIFRTYRLIETLYPITLVSALLLGTLLPVLMILQEQREAAILRALGWSKKLTIRRLTLEQAALCLTGLILAIAVLFAVNGLGFLGVILVPVLYVIAHFALCVGASAAISASILQKSPMRLLQAKE